MFDMRYHIASLVAVFLALTVGLLLGSLLVDSGVLTRSQTVLMKSIKSDVGSVLQKNRLLEKQNRQLKDFQAQVWLAAVKGRLADQKIVVLSLSASQDDIYENLSKALNQAGAKSAHIKLDTSKINFADQAQVSSLAASIGSTATTGTFETSFWPRLAQELSGREPLTLASALISQNLLSIDDQTVLPADGVVLLASSKSSINNRDTKILEALKQVPDLAVIGAETSDRSPSRISAYQLVSISTIDDVETVPGWISLVYLIQEKATKASYGVKSTAERLLPQ